MFLLLALFSHVLLCTAAWRTTPSSSIHTFYSVGGKHTNGRRSTVSKARVVISTVTLTSTAGSNKLFAHASEDTPLLPPSPPRGQPREGKRRWKLFPGESLRGGDAFRWTPLKIAQATLIFVLAGIAEIGGGWMVWKAVRENKPWWWAVVGSLVMVLYAFLPTLQPTDSFGRIYAVYGGFFIGLSYIWGWLFDGMKPDTGDVVGGCLALLAVLIIQYWPRQQ